MKEVITLPCGCVIELFDKERAYVYKLCKSHLWYYDDVAKYMRLLYFALSLPIPEQYKENPTSGK